jgi:hypothetical protein
MGSNTTGNAIHPLACGVGAQYHCGNNTAIGFGADVTTGDLTNAGYRQRFLWMLQ